MMGLLIYKYEPFWQEVSVKSLILRWPLRPVGLLFNNLLVYWLKKLYVNITMLHINIIDKYVNIGRLCIYMNFEHEQCQILMFTGTSTHISLDNGGKFQALLTKFVSTWNVDNLPSNQTPLPLVARWYSSQHANYLYSKENDHNCSRVWHDKDPSQCSRVWHDKDPSQCSRI